MAVLSQIPARRHCRVYGEPCRPEEHRIWTGSRSSRARRSIEYRGRCWSDRACNSGSVDMVIPARLALSAVRLIWTVTSSLATLSPTLCVVTSSPTAITSPELSCAMVIGSTVGRPATPPARYPCMSLPHMPVAMTLTSTPSGCRTGIGVSRMTTVRFFTSWQAMLGGRSRAVTAAG